MPPCEPSAPLRRSPIPDVGTPTLLREDRPGLWPHVGAEKALPTEIEQDLRQAAACVFADPLRTLDLAEHAVQLARADGSILARTLYQAAVLVQQAGDPVGAYTMCLDAQPLLERQDDRWRATMVLLLRSWCCLSVDEHERAKALIAEAIHRFESMSDAGALAVCHQLMATAHGMGSEPCAAVDAIGRAVAAAAREGLSDLRRSIAFDEAQLRLALADHWSHRGQTDRALRERAAAYTALPPLEQADIACWSPHRARHLEIFVRVAGAHGRSAAARQALLALLAWARTWRNRRERGVACHELAEWRRSTGRRSAAIADVRRAIRHLSLFPLDPRLLEAQCTLADMLEADGDLRGAYAAHALASRTEAEQRRHAVARRAELLMLDHEAEQELRKSEQTLAYAQRLSGVGHLVASVNHELNQPMASIRMLAETSIALIEQGDTTECRASVQAMHRISTRLVDVTSKLAAFPAQASTPPQNVDLRFAVQEALATLSSRLAQTPCAIEIDIHGVTVLAEEGQLVRVIVNLVNNALDIAATLEAPRIWFRCTRLPNQVVLSVRDNGPGLSESARSRLFQPFFSTKPAGQGLGLGLAMSRQVMREMGGDLTGYDATCGGAQFDIVLPSAELAHVGPAQTATPPSSS